MLYINLYSSVCQVEGEKKVRSSFLNIVYFWLRWVLVAPSRLSLVVMSGAYFLLQVTRFFIAVASLVAEHRL